jgi:hypothetical protein
MEDRKFWDGGQQFADVITWIWKPETKESQWCTFQSELRLRVEDWCSNLKTVRYIECILSILPFFFLISSSLDQGGPIYIGEDNLIYYSSNNYFLKHKEFYSYSHILSFLVLFILLCLVMCSVSFFFF